MVSKKAFSYAEHLQFSTELQVRYKKCTITVLVQDTSTAYEPQAWRAHGTRLCLRKKGQFQYCVWPTHVAASDHLNIVNNPCCANPVNKQTQYGDQKYEHQFNINCHFMYWRIIYTDKRFLCEKGASFYGAVR